MKIIALGCIAAVVVLHIGAAAAADDKVSDANYDAKIQHADADYKVAMAKCDALEGNNEDICEAEAEKGREVAQQNAKAEHEGTAEARAGARKQIADEELKVAKQKCDRLAGNAHDVCVKEAQLKHKQTIAAAETNKEIAEARDDEREVVSDARYELAMEKCENLRGDAQNSCEQAAKAQKAD